MIKKFFAFSFVLSSVLSLSMYGETEILEENQQSVACDEECYEEEKVILTSKLDALFQTLLESSQGLCEDLLALYRDETTESKQVFEALSCLPSGQKLISTCEKIFEATTAPVDEATNEVEFLEKTLQKLDEISRVWQHDRSSKEIDYANRELDIRERELEFKKELLLWQKERADKELSWKKEKYARETLLQK